MKHVLTKMRRSLVLLLLLKFQEGKLQEGKLQDSFRRRIFVQLLAIFAFYLSASVYAAPMKSPLDYADLPLGWSREAMINAVEKELLYGADDMLMPKLKLTRAQLAAVANRLVNANETADISRLTDVTEQAWYYEDISKAVYHGFLPEYENTLSPDQHVTRAEVFASLSKALDITPLRDTRIINQLEDHELVSVRDRGRIAAMVEKGYMLSRNNRLYPEKTITREEFAYVLNQILEAEGH